MPEYVLEESGAARTMTVLQGGLHGKDPEHPAVVAAAEQVQRVLSWEQQVIEATRAEIDDYFIRLKQLSQLEPDQVFLVLSAMTARLTEIRTQLIRTTNRRLQALRTKEIDPLLDEADRQFKFHSRIQAVRSLDWEVTRGAP